jgi:hypothetical protein
MIFLVFVFTSFNTYELPILNTNLYKSNDILINLEATGSEG